MRPFIVDCDTGRDDALTIWAATRLGLPLRAIVTSYGNVPVDQVTENSLRVAELSGLSIPVLAGADSPTRDHHGYRTVVEPRQRVSGNGLCNLDLPLSTRTTLDASSSTLLADHIRKLTDMAGPVDYVIIGPATNFARLCDALGPTLHDHIASVTMMGGKLDALWRQMPGADFNLICDPFAVNRILQGGFPVRFLPMNVTWPILLTVDELEALRPRDPLAETARALMIAHAQHFAPEPVFRFHDPTILFAMMEPALFSPCRLQIDCDEQSADFGRLTLSDAGFPAAIFQPGEAFGEKCLSATLDALGLDRPAGAS